jgi:hypothetical protein
MKSMKPGDLVRVTLNTWGVNRRYGKGEIGIVLGLAEDDHNRSHSCVSVLFGSGKEDFTDRFLEIINEK